MRRIQRVSKVVKLVAHALSVVSLISAGILSVTAFVTLSENASIQALALHSGVVSLVLMVVFHKLAKLAERYEQGDLFGAANVRHLRVIGWLLLLTAMNLGLSNAAAVEDVTLEVGFNPGSVVGGFLFIFMSWVMDEARKLGEEHSLTI